MSSSELRPTLLFLVAEDWYFASHRLTLARAAVQAGYRVVVATRVTTHGDQIRAVGCEVIPLGWRRKIQAPWRELRDLLQIVRLYRELAPSLVHHVALKPIIYGSIAARLVGVQRVVNAVAGLGHIFTAQSLRARALRPVLRLLLRHVVDSPRTRVIVQNPDDRQVLLRARIARPDRLVLIRGVGVDLGLFRHEPFVNGSPVVLLASRMLWDKGVGEFVEAAKVLRTRGFAARFALVGDTDADNPGAIPRAQLIAWSHEGYVEWWGLRTDMPAVLSQAQIVCLPSAYGEGLPKILLEAAAAGRPIVASNAPGCREVVIHEHNGLLVPVRDVAALASAIATLLLDPALCREMGLRGRRLAETQFSADRSSAETLLVYHELLSEHRQL